MTLRHDILDFVRFPEDFRVTRPLARGGFAEIFEALRRDDTGIEHPVALKKLRPHLAKDESYARSFRDEARILEHLDHPNIVKLLDLGVADGCPFQVLELIDGGDLESLAAIAGTVPEDIALFAMREIGLALGHAHRARSKTGAPLDIVHRDVTPENILISRQGDVKLCDFGIASAVGREEKTALGIAKGKLEYMAPEQIRGEPIDRRADIFSLGCVLHRLLTGVSPIDEPRDRDRVVAGLDPVFHAEIVEDVREILRRAVSADPSRRFTSAEAFAGACDAALLQRIDEAPRGLLARWFSELEPTFTGSRLRHGAMDLVDLDLILERHQGHAAREPSASRAPDSRGTELEPGTALTFTGTHPAGTRVGRYLITAVLGQGASATVYRAEHAELGAALAIKVLHARCAQHPIVRRRLAREARLLSILDHPNIVKVLDFSVEEGELPYVVSELVPGRTLARIIQEEAPLSEERVLLIAEQLVRGLSAAHGAGIVHRDLKPSNVIITALGPTENAKIIDFGIARALEPPPEETQLTAIGARLGTPGYMAPEQLEDPSGVSPSADLYALGWILYAMRTGGRPPPSELGKGDLPISAQLVPPLRSDDPLRPLIQSLLSSDPIERPKDTESVLAFLGALSAEAHPTEVEASPGAARATATLARTVLAGPEATSMRPPRGRGWLWAVVFPLAALALSLTLLTAHDRGAVGERRFDPDALAPNPIRSPSAIRRSPAARALTDSMAAADEGPPADLPDGATHVARRSSGGGTTSIPRGTSPARRVPSRSTSSAAGGVQGALARALSRHGVRASDLETSELGRAWLLRLEAAGADAREKRAILSELPGILDSVIDADLVIRRLQSTSKLLENGQKRIAPEQLEAWERRYFEIRAALAPDTTRDRIPDLLSRANALEREVREELGSDRAESGAHEAKRGEMERGE